MLHCYVQVRKRDGVPPQQNTELKFQGLEPPQDNVQQENGEGMEQQQQPPMRGMVNTKYTKCSTHNLFIVI